MSRAPRREGRERLALEVLGLAGPELELETELEAPSKAERERARAELEQTASWLAELAEPALPPPALRARLLAELDGSERLAPFVDRVADLFDLAVERARAVLERFASDEGWTIMFPGAAYLDLEGGPALRGATAGLVRLAAGLSFPHHRHLGEERVFVLQGAFIDSSGRRVEAGDLVAMADGSAHGFEVASEQELLYAVVVGQIEFDDGSRAP